VRTGPLSIGVISGVSGGDAKAAPLTRSIADPKQRSSIALLLNPTPPFRNETEERLHTSAYRLVACPFYFAGSSALLRGPNGTSFAGATQ
jgi:hypothetical protein